MVLSNRHYTRYLIAPITLSLMVSACSTASKTSAPDNTAQSDTDDTRIVDTHSEDGIDKIGISMPTQYLERWTRDGNNLKASFEALGYEVDLHYAGNLIDTQIDAIYEMIDDGVDVLVIGAVDGLSLGKVMERAYEAGIPVVAYDRLICNTEYVSAYVSFDNYQVGRLQGEYIKNALELDKVTGKIYNIEFTAGDSVDNNARFFFDGAMDVLRPYIDKGTLNVPSGQCDFYTVSTSQWSTETANVRFQILIGSYYSGDRKLDAVLCSNDSTSIGVQDAIRDSYNGGNDVVITGQDCDVENLRRLMDGRQSMDVYKNLAYEAYVTVMLVDSLYHGEVMSQSLIDSWNLDYECVYDTQSYDNGKIVVPAFLLEPVEITSDNMVQELVDNYGTYVLSEDGSLQVAE
ncbi:substrate-binding domain-containing protein [Butyrivibrio sp. TB]|uniref:substrate-binding domain-containing protein n=1 Tax=Butyrivibrio sp. TB TaxID=1520809 RepID=UPI0008B89B91|nr:sugar-binding protein [Butyrivibrio sp. TB]SEQ01575.1 putative multiple sugar transport system substrate-binding protein [Butyrivibrio sp. TB]